MTTTATTAAPASNTAAATYQRLRAHLAYLKLTAAAEALPSVLDTARLENLPVLDALERLLGTEAEATAARKLHYRVHLACLPAPWTLDDYDYSAQPGADEALIRELGTLRFLEDIGQHRFHRPARGGQDDARDRAGPRRSPSRAQGVLHHLRGPHPPAARAIAEHRYATGLRFFTQPKLLVIDELGYRRLDEDARSLLFEVINARYLKGSIITTSHVGISDWADRLGDPMLAAALLDRLLHHGIIAAIDGPSYRMRAHQQRAEAIRKATRPGGRP